MRDAQGVLLSASGLPFAPAPAGYKYRTHTAFTAGTIGLVARTRSVEELALAMPADGTPVVVFTSFGYVNGRQMFSSSRMRRFGRGIEVLRPNGDTLLIHPFGRGRTITFLNREG